MARTLRYMALILAFGLAPAGAGGPAVAAAVALAVEVTGKTDPAIEPFTELESGTSIQLDANTKIEFLHYNSCQTIVVHGGRITFTEQQYLVRGGELVSAERTKCPEVAAAGTQGGIGGVLMRSGGAGLKLRPQPRFAFVGQSRAGYDRLRVLKGGTVLLESALADNQFAWPAAEAPLAVGKDYALELSGKGDARTRIGFEVEERRGTVPLTIVRLD